MEVEPVSRLLEQVNAGDRQALEALASAVYGELRRMAGALMRGQLNGHTLQPTALVNEAFLRLTGGETRWDGQAHFFGSAARAMRQVLVAHAREKSAQKRAGQAVRVTFCDLGVTTKETRVDLLLLDDAMTALGREDGRFVQVMDLRYFAGCTLPEIAELTGRSLASVKRDCSYARAWLYEYMNG